VMQDIPPVLSASGNESLPWETKFFDTTAFLGLAMNAAVLAPAVWSPRIQRRSGWYTLVISWIIYSASLILTIGHQIGPEPPAGLCLAQAAILYAAPIL
ncbi:hypothetical protein H0H87_009123, partial [Tephrocybe sp. NHM501043]